MPIIHYRRFTEAEAEKIRQIFGVRKSTGRQQINLTQKQYINRLEKVEKELGVSDHDVEKLVRAVINNLPGFFYAQDKNTSDSREIEVHLNPIGDKLPRMIGGLTAHELGHTTVYKRVWPTIRDRIAWQGVQDNFLLNELIATYYSRAKSRDERTFRVTLSSLRKFYKRIKEEEPEALHGASFEDFQTEAAMIVMRDLEVDPGPPPMPVRKVKTIYKAGKKQHPGKLPPSMGAMN